MKVTWDKGIALRCTYLRIEGVQINALGDACEIAIPDGSWDEFVREVNLADKSQPSIVHARSKKREESVV